MCNDDNKDSDNKRYHKSSTRDLFDISTIFLASIFSGFILGLLFAPRSGLKTRKIINEKLKDIIDRGKFTLVEAKAIGKDLLNKSKKKVDRVSTIIKGIDETG